jgi:RNA polymerase sigma factor (sigma-70 family)
VTSPAPSRSAGQYDPQELAALVRRAQRGDPLAASHLIETLAPYVSRLCGPIALRDGQDAAQEALLAIFRGLRTLRDPLALLGWVRAITVREAVKVANRTAMTIPAELSDVPAKGDPMLAADVQDVLRRLSPEHRAVLTLRDLEGLGEEAVSALLAVPAGTVRSRLFRARNSFRKAWQ